MNGEGICGLTCGAWTGAEGMALRRNCKDGSLMCAPPVSGGIINSGVG